jgi:hypothetical protein
MHVLIGDERLPTNIVAMDLKTVVVSVEDAFLVVKEQIKEQKNVICDLFICSLIC